MKVEHSKKLKNLFLIILFTILTIIFGTSSVKALAPSGKWNSGRNLPQFSYSVNGVNYPQYIRDENNVVHTVYAQKTGLFPQNLDPGKKMIIEKLNSGNGWKASYTKGMVYCADQNRMLRNGSFDNNTYYILNKFDNFNTIEDYLRGVLTSEVGDSYGSQRGFAIDNVELTENLPSEFNRDAMFMPIPRSGKVWTKKDVEALVGDKILEIYNGLDSSYQPNAFSEEIDVPHGTRIRTNSSVDYEQGPLVTLMETPEGSHNGYQESQLYTVDINDNPEVAYILTSLSSDAELETRNNLSIRVTNENGSSTLRDGDNNSEVPVKLYSEADIQSAYWIQVDPDRNDNVDNADGTINEEILATYITTGKITEDGKKIYMDSKKFVKFLEELRNGYEPKINEKDAKVIVHRSEKEYIVGPYSIDYLDYPYISYMKYMTITNKDNESKKITLDASNKEFELILEQGGNEAGLPKSGEGFYIAFKADKLDYPTDIKLNFGFEYLNNAQVQYKVLDSKADTYQYVAYMDNDTGAHPMIHGTFTWTVYYHYDVYARYGS